ncbi:hypothetical protein V8E55_005181 [Tylopilus felleus]
MWYGLIQDIRVQRLNKTYKAWIAITWYYRKGDIPGKEQVLNIISPDVGKLELVMSDHLDIIAPEQIMSPADIMHFIEENPSGSFVGRDDLYMRWSMNIGNGKPVLKVCKKAYNPDRDEQRYCYGCESWFHCKCLESLPKGSNEMKELVIQISKDKELSLDEDLLELLCIPTFRGRRHGVVGNGMLTSAIWKSFLEAREAEKKEMGLNWRDHITRDVIAQARKSYIYYHCPVCLNEAKRWYL